MRLRARIEAQELAPVPAHVRRDAPRFLRASVGAIGLAVAFGLSRLFRAACPAHAPPSREEIERAARVARESGRADTNLATLGDKALLFGESGGLLMYAVSGRSWVAFGDPIGSPQEQTELAWRLKEVADRHGGRPVFYEVGSAHLPIYLDLGLSLFKIGEEARVPLESFSLEGGERRGMRRALGMVERKGGTFEIVPPHEVPALLPELERVSNAWLASKHTREKGFSLGFFDETYLSRFPIALVRREGRVVAFANVWLAPARDEISVDLMRHEHDAPHAVPHDVVAEHAQIVTRRLHEQDVDLRMLAAITLHPVLHPAVQHDTQRLVEDVGDPAPAPDVGSGAEVRRLVGVEVQRVLALAEPEQRPHLQLEQPGHEHEELAAGLEVELPLLVQALDERQDDLRHVHVRQLELLPEDERQQQVERPLEGVQVEGKLTHGRRHFRADASGRAGRVLSEWPSSSSAQPALAAARTAGARSSAATR